MFSFPLISAFVLELATPLHLSSSAKQNISTKPSKDLPTGNEENIRSPLHPRQNISTTDQQKSSVTPRNFQFADQQNTYGNLSRAESRDYATSRGEWLPSVHKPYNLDISLTTSLLCWESETPNLPKPCDGEFLGLCSYDPMIFDQDTCSKSLLAMDIGPLSHAEFYNANTDTPFSARGRSLSGKALKQIAPGFPASRVRGTQSQPPRSLSPTAPPFIPSSYNSFRILETCQDSEEPPVEQFLNGYRDKIDQLNCFSTSRLLKLNALEDVAPYSGEPALYTHSEGDSINLLKLKKLLDEYSSDSGQVINSAKSKFYVKDTTNSSHLKNLEKILAMQKGTLPFTYLGATICKGKLKKHHCGNIMDHFDKHIQSWYSKKLNQMGRLILIKHVLSSIPLHILAVLSLPISVIHLLHSRMANFFLGSRHGNQLHH
ncbi:unnamed protein product [Cuscuta campestris]|uniref:Reverse transcriptase Ty1/copia-type domain-containing protein n=1 Tax=Cuscuta campestris TaxID=132261 RepID=A0A484N4L8_9ASTE|nr:unnamed protein product [Cuscuta campestris]